MKTRVTQSTEISGLEVGQRVARSKMHIPMKARMEFLTKGAVQPKADLAQGGMGVQERKIGQGVARQTLRVHQIQGGAHKRRKARGKGADQG